MKNPLHDSLSLKKTSRSSLRLGRVLAASLALLAGARLGAAQVVVHALPAGVTVRISGGIGASGAAAPSERAISLPSADFTRDLAFQMDRISLSRTSAQPLSVQLQGALREQIRAGVPLSRAVATHEVLVQAMRNPETLAGVRYQILTTKSLDPKFCKEAEKRLTELCSTIQDEKSREELNRYIGKVESLLAASLRGDSPDFSQLYDGSRLAAKGREAPLVDAHERGASGSEKIRRSLTKPGMRTTTVAEDIPNSETSASGETEMVAEVLSAAEAQRMERAFPPRGPPAAARGGVADGPLVQPELKPDFVDVGMGPTGMMAMLAAVASGRTAVGVEMRGDPQRGVHMNIREEWYHQLAAIDQRMLKTYGEAGIPKLPNGKPFILADFFYNSERPGGPLDFGDIFGKGDEQNQNLGGRLHTIAFEDARDETRRANGGKSKLFVLPPPALPRRADPSKVSGDMKKVLDSPSAFQAALLNYEQMLRAYLKAIETQDREAGRTPRVKIYENHRVAQENGAAVGYADGGRGKRRIIIEEVVDQNGKDGATVRVRKPGTRPIDLGVPIRFALTPGFGGGADAKTLGYAQDNVAYHDPETGKTIVASQNWIAGEVTANIGGQLLRRVSTMTDPKTGKTQTVRQIAVGHELAPNVAWILVQIPDFITFDPIAAGKVPAGTDPKSAKYAAAARKMFLDYYVSQVSAVIHTPEADIRKMRMFYGPAPFTLKERIGKTARVAANGNVAGDLMGNGHFLTSGGAMTGMIGHASRFLKYWDDLNHGVPQAKAARALEAGIKTDSKAWLHVSAKEFDGLSPANFGQERAKAIGITADKTPPAPGSNGPGYGLAAVLGQGSWAKSFMRLLRGEFGMAGKDFYVPAKQLDITPSPDVTVHKIGLPAKKAK